MCTGRTDYAFVMYNNLGEWLSPAVAASTQQPAATTTTTTTTTDDDDDDDDETSNNDTRHNRVVNSVIISLATTSSVTDQINLTEPLSFTLRHIHVIRSFLVL